MEPQQVFCFLSPEIEALLAENQTDVVELLRHEGLDVSKGFAQALNLSTESGHKEPVSVIIASAAVIVALTPVLSRVIEVLSHRPVVVEEQVLTPLEDGKGNLVCDEVGKPVLHWVNRSHLLRSELGPRRDASSVEIRGPLGISITYQSASTR
jgi:hypothetical protein